jgi:signal transduction histidine kinase
MNASYRNICRHLTVCFLLVVLHVHAAAGEPLLQRKMPPTFTSLPLLIRTFTQKGTSSQRALIAFENRSIALMYYFQNEYEIKEFPMDFPVTDIVEAYKDDKSLDDNYFLISTRDSVYLYILGKAPLRRITAVYCKGNARFLPGYNGTEIIAYNREHVYVIHLSNEITDIARIDEIYKVTSNDILGIAAIPGTDRVIIACGDECVSLRTDGTLQWVVKLPVPIKLQHELENMEIISAIARESLEAQEIWDSYEPPVRVFRDGGSYFLLYPGEGSLVISELSEKGCHYRADVPCDGCILDICPSDSSVVVTGGSHTGTRYTGFLIESAYGGDVLRHITLSYPGVFINRIAGGFVLQGFRNHLVLFGTGFRILAIDHSPLYPTCLETLYLDNDGSEDILVGGLSARVSLADTLVENTIDALGPQESFSFLALSGNRYTGDQYRVDAFLVGVDRTMRAAAGSLEAARLTPYNKQYKREVRNRLYASRELYYLIGDESGVALCDSELDRLAQTIFEREWLVPFVVIGCLIGGFTGFLSIKKKPFLVGGLICISYALFIYNMLSHEAAQRVGLIGVVSLLAVSIIRIGLKRKRTEIPLPGPTIDKFRSFLMALGAFEHSGRATRILESLNLLLLSLPDSPEDLPGYCNRLLERSGKFLDSVGPQIREISELLQSIIPKRALSLELGIIHDDLERSLRAIRTHEFPDKQQVSNVAGNIDRLDGYMRNMRRFVKKYPGTPVQEVVGEVVESKKNEIDAQGVDLRIINRLEYTKIVHIARHELEAICENLLSNSLKALRSSDRRKIIIDLYDEDEFVVFEHSDSGPGIGEAEAKNIFSPRDDIEKGGFGLPYSRFVLEKVNGSIDLGLGRIGGATFLIRLRPWHLVMRSFLLQEGSRGNSAAEEITIEP